MLKIKKKKAYLIIIAVIVLSIIFVPKIIHNISLCNDPYYMIESKLGLDLPASAEVINYTYDFGNFGAKILLTEQGMNDIKERYDGLWPGDDLDYSVYERYIWWDLNKKDVLYYGMFLRGNYTFWGFAGTSTSFMYISEADSGNYYLYISY